MRYDETEQAMFFARSPVAVVFAGLVASIPAYPSHLVTGNGFGFAVVAPETGTVTKFYAHPYSCVRPDPKDPLSEGVETTNFIKELSWGSQSANATSAEYFEDSHVIHSQNSEGDGLIFMPFGLSRPVLVISWEPNAKKKQADGLRVEWSHPLRSAKTVRLLGIEMQVLKFEGVEESLLLIPLGRELSKSSQDQQYLASSRAWALVSIEDSSELQRAAGEFERWRVGLTPQALVQREIAEIEHWRVRPTVHFLGENERHLWRQSEVMLRIAQSREQNRPGRHSNGLIVASLPDGVWFTPWVRDMAYAADAFARMGHRDEARAALLAYFNAQPTGKMREQTHGADYQVSVVRYFGDGSEEPFFTMEGSTNIELDDWGLVLWLLGDYMREFDDTALLRTPTYRGHLYESARDFVVNPLLANLETNDGGLIVAADTSIWEERQKDKKHFAFSTAAAIVGLQGFANVAGRARDETTRADILSKIALLKKGFAAAFIRAGKLRGTLEEGVKNDIDGALLTMINFGVVTDPTIVGDTLDRMELLKVPSGGYRRVRGTYTDPSIFEYWYEKQEFLFIDFSLAEVLRRRGKIAESDAILKRIVDKAAADHNIIPEMYVAEGCKLFPGELGDPTGALPMAGYGAGAYILELLEREKQERNR